MQPAVGGTTMQAAVGGTAIRRRAWVLYLAAAVPVLVLLFLWERDAYVNYAEGVYLFSARLITDGQVPYRDFIAAHPPLLFYSGAAILSIGDSLDAVRIGLALVSLATGGLVATAVVRLTGSAPAAALAGVVSLLAPWSLHEHATLTPETFGAPLLLGAALLAARARTAVPAGLLAAVAVGYKWPFLFPALLLVAAAPARVRYAAALLGGFAAGVVLSFVLFGSDRLYHQLVVAQQDVGWHGVRYIGGLLGQAGWNLIPLLIPAAVGLALAPRNARDPVLVRTLLAVAIGTLVLVGTIAKTGTYLNTIALAEPPLVALGAAGLVWALRERRRAAAAAFAAAALFGAVQVADFIAAPTHPHAGLYVRPFSARAGNWAATAEEVHRIEQQARRCAARVPFSGQPFYAFVANRRMPGDEPDQFLRTKTPVGAPHEAEAQLEPLRCP
jgi:hypothetical protein